MVDFPEGYGFKPGTKRYVLQSTFTVVLGTFTVVDSTYYSRNFRNRRSPYTFNEVGVIRKEPYEDHVTGTLLNQKSGPVIEGALQQVVTALCTVHRMTGGET